MIRRSPSVFALLWLALCSTPGHSQINWHSLSNGYSQIDVIDGNFFLSGDTVATSHDGQSFVDRIPVAGSSKKVVKYGANYFALSPWISGYQYFRRSSDGIRWTTGIQSGRPELNAAAAGNGDLVLAGEGGYVIVESGGRQIEYTVPQIGTTRDLLFANGQFVSASTKGIFSFTHPTNSTPLLLVENLLTIHHLNGLFFAGGAQGIYTSTNLLEWRHFPTPAAIHDVCFGDDLYLAAADGGHYFTSVDGIAWQQRHTGLEHSNLSVAYSRGVYLMAARAELRDFTLLQSTNGLVWRQYRTPPSRPWGNAVAWGPHGFVVAPLRSEQFLYSPDGLNWTSTYQLPPLVEFTSVNYACDRYIAVGGTPGIITSMNGRGWTPVTNNPASPPFMAVGGNATFAIASGPQRTIHTTNGVDWSWLPELATAQLFGISYAQGKFVAVGSPGIIISENGLNWRRVTNQLPSVIYRCVLGTPSAFLVGGDGGNLVYSRDGSDWQVVPHQPVGRILSISRGHSAFIATADVGAGINGGAYLLSGDGINWTRLIQPYQLGKAAWGDGKFVAVQGNRYLSISHEPTLDINYSQFDLTLLIPGSPTNVLTRLETSTDLSNWETQLESRGFLGASIPLPTSSPVKFHRLRFE